MNLSKRKQLINTLGQTTEPYGNRTCEEVDDDRYSYHRDWQGEAFCKNYLDSIDNLAGERGLLFLADIFLIGLLAASLILLYKIVASTIRPGAPAANFGNLEMKHFPPIMNSTQGIQKRLQEEKEHKEPLPGWQLIPTLGDINKIGEAESKRSLLKDYLAHLHSMHGDLSAFYQSHYHAQPSGDVILRVHPKSTVDITSGRAVVRQSSVPDDSSSSSFYTSGLTLHSSIPIRNVDLKQPLLENFSESKNLNMTLSCANPT